MTTGTSALQLAIALRLSAGGCTDEPAAAVTTQIITEMVVFHGTAADLMVAPRPHDVVPRHPTAAFFRKLACMPVPPPSATG